jgi:hypothetical protein
MNRSNDGGRLAIATAVTYRLDVGRNLENGTT